MGQRGLWPWMLLWALLLAGPADVALAQGAPPSRSPAAALMKRRLYRDAVRALLVEIGKQPEAQSGRQFLMLGECYYMLGDYGRSRPYFRKARQHCAKQNDQLIADYRLACCAYRLKDPVGAMSRIDAFVKAHATNRRSGTLLLFKMKILAGRGKGAESAMEAVHRKITVVRAFGSAARLAADKVLTEFYLAHGQEEKAKRRYASIVHNFRNVIQQYGEQKRPVPKGMEQAHDHAAMQLGVLNVKTKRYAEAVKWLENVRYDPELKRQARLMLAQVAYQRRDFRKAAGYLTKDGLLETVPAGKLRSDMCLLLGLCERNQPTPSPAKVESYLKQVGRESKGYYQAQAGLGDLYHERGLVDRAIRAYGNAVSSPKYEAHALYHLGQLMMAKAARTAEPAKQAAIYRDAARHISQLGTKYPNSLLAKQAGESINALLSKGFNVSVATTDVERIRRWQQTVRKSPGSGVAARALINLARLHHKAVMDEKSKRYVKAPNFLACAGACDTLLEGGKYTGKDLDPAQWKLLRCEGHYYRGLSHLASVAPPKSAAGGAGVTPTYIAKSDLPRAIDDFTEAQKLVDPKRLDLVRNIELALLEALFKSDKQEHRKKAQARFAELVNDYGTDVRFQKLAMDLAEWYRGQKRFAEAAREYRGIADRGANLAQEDVLKALFMGGKLYGQAAHEARNNPGARKYGITICPRQVLKLADLRKSYPPLQKKIRVVLPEKGVRGDKALREVSGAAGVPFVWSRRGGSQSVDHWLRNKRVTFPFLNGTVAEFLEHILDFQRHRLDFDIGITGGKATFTPKPPDPDDPDRPEAVKTIEIYDASGEAERYAPMAHRYGAWKSVHKKSGMMFHVIRRIEELTETKVLWAEGVPKDDVLAWEFDQVPGVDGWRSRSCGQTLAALLGARDLRFRIVPRDRSAEFYDAAKDCFNEIRKIEPRSKYGESSLFQLALNFYRQEDYERMKIVLKEYLKLFDSARHEHHHEACFWVGWVFEHESRYRDACRWYNRAAEERLVVSKPARGAKGLSPEQRKAQLSYDTLFALEETVTGELKGLKLDNDLVEYVKLNTNVAIRLEAGATGIETPIDYGPFEKKPVLDVLCDVLDKLHLSFRAENVNEAVAKKALYRLASSYKKDGLMPQALTSCNLLLSRFPDTARRVAAIKLMLEIHKGLKQYRNVLATLERLKKEGAGEIEPYQIDFEIAWIYFDLCRYDKALGAFRRSLSGAKAPAERVKIRDGYARTLFRSGLLAEALSQYRTLLKEETVPLHAFVDRMMVWYLEQATREVSQAKLPEEASRLIRWYTALPDEQREKLPRATLAKVTWVYYAAALLELGRGQRAQAIEKLKAVGNSPDDWLAADAIFRIGRLHMKARKWKKARESFEYLLFSTKSAEAEVKATFQLGICHEALGEPAKARARFDQVLKRFPDSSYADRIHGRRRKGPATTRSADESSKPPASRPRP
ncbi:MAG TPA: tetratricopeptide repeat protein [Phycisphaerae bacterium]|nr:tetratricopeptide repeat protein [Phycisphaerae bacterium]